MAKVCEFCGKIISLMSRYCVYRGRRIMCKDCYRIFLEMRDDISAKIEEKERKERKRSVNKHLILLGIVVLLICVGLSGCMNEDNSQDGADTSNEPV